MRLLSLISVLAVVVAVCCLSLPSPVRALTIQFDYTYDGGFFTDPLVNPQASEARAALERAGKDFEMLVDDLARIEHSDAQQNTWEARFQRPDTGAWHWEPNVVVPAATLIVYVGGRSIGAGTLASGGPGGANYTYTTLEWFETVTTRGQPGAAAGAETDFGPWGGWIVFNSTSDWHYHTVAPPMGSEADFLSTAVHELCHVLGYGTSASWDNRIPAGSLLFTGEAATARSTCRRRRWTRT